MPKSILTKTIWLLGLISLFTDMASEMLYPVMPLYLESIGFTVIGIGILEGIAQAAAGLGKGFFGHWSDSTMRRVPFVQWGYLLSALSKPLMAVWTNAWWVMGTRTSDRIGKGIRSAAKDAMLSANATRATKGRIFGFHRGMDTLGAALGPGLALIYLWIYPGSYRMLFFLALVPGMLAVLFTFFLKEKHSTSNQIRRKPSFKAWLRYFSSSSHAYRKVVIGLLAFALINSSDFFLLLVLKEKGFSDTLLIGIYIFYNMVFALTAFPAGAMADRWGKKFAFILGLALFAIVYFGLAFTQNLLLVGLLFVLYGVYAAFTEGVAKAWISNLCREEEMATAIGTYDGLSSVAALLASSTAGLIWYQFGFPTLFILTSILTLVIILYFLPRGFKPG